MVLGLRRLPSQHIEIEYYTAGIAERCNTNKVNEEKRKQSPNHTKLLTITVTLLRLLQTLLARQLRIPNTQRKRNKRHRQANTRNAQNPLRMHVSQDNRIPVRRANRVRLRKGERVRVHLCSEGRIAERLRQFRDQRLGPDCAGDGASQGGTDVV